MKVAVSACGPSPSSPVDPRFGRCSHFVIFDTVTFASASMTNPNLAAAGGAGIRTAQMLADKGVEAVLTGNVGPHAMKALDAAGITVCVVDSETAIDAVRGFTSGSLRPFRFGSHSGTNK